MRRILYLSCDAFINQFITAVESNEMNNFRHRYRDADLLIIDDIHFLAGKDRTQEEFFHTFNTLYQQHRQIIISPTARPAESLSWKNGYQPIQLGISRPHRQALLRDARGDRAEEGAHARSGPAGRRDLLHRRQNR